MNNNKYSLSLQDRDCIEKFLRMQLRKKKDGSDIIINNISLAVARILSLYKGITIDKDILFNISVHRNWKILHKKGVFEILGKTNNESKLQGVVKHRTGSKWMIIKDGISYNVPLPSCMQNRPPKEWYPFIQYLTNRALIASLQNKINPTDFDFTFDGDLTKYIPFNTFNSLSPRTNIPSILLDFLNANIISLSYIHNIIQKSNILIYFTTNAAIHNEGDNYNIDHKISIYNELFMLLSTFNRLSYPENKEIYEEMIRIDLFNKNEMKIHKLINKMKKSLIKIISIFFQHIHGVYEAYLSSPTYDDKYKLSHYMKERNNKILTDKDDYDLLIKMDTTKKNMLPLTLDFYIYNNEYTSLIYQEHISKKIPRNDNIPCIVIHSIKIFESELKTNKNTAYYDTFTESIIQHHAIMSKVMLNNNNFNVKIGDDIIYIYNKKLSSSKDKSSIIKSLYPFQSDIDLFMFHSLISPNHVEQDIHTRIITPGMILLTPFPHISNDNKGIRKEQNDNLFIEDFRSFCNFTDVDTIAPVFGSSNILFNYHMKYTTENNFRTNPLNFPIFVDFPNIYAKTTTSPYINNDEHNRDNKELKAIGISFNDPARISRLQSYNANTSINNPLLRIVHRLYPNTIKRYSPCINYATISILAKKHLLNPIETFGSLDVFTIECLVCYAFVPVFLGCISTARDALDQILTSCDASFYNTHLLSLKLKLKSILTNRSLPLIPLSNLSLNRHIIISKHKLTMIHIIQCLLDCFLIPARNHLLKQHYGKVVVADSKQTLLLSSISIYIEKEMNELLHGEVSLGLVNLNTPVLHLHCAIRSLADSIHVLQGNLLPEYNHKLSNIPYDKFAENTLQNKHIHISERLLTENNIFASDDHNILNFKTIEATFLLNKLTSESKHNQIKVTNHYYTADITITNSEAKNNNQSGVKHIVKQYLCKDKTNNPNIPRIYYTCIHGVLFGMRSLYNSIDRQALNIRSCINLCGKSNRIWELVHRLENGNIQLQTEYINLSLMKDKSLYRYFFYHKYAYNNENRRFELYLS